MQINLYGVSSINLDKLRGRQIKNYLKCLFVVYAIIFILSFNVPDRLEEPELDMGYEVDNVKSYDPDYRLEPTDLKIFRFRHWFELTDKSLSNFDIIIGELKAVEHAHEFTTNTLFESLEFQKNHYLNIRVKWYETDSKDALSKYKKNQEMEEPDILALGFTKIEDAKNHVGEPLNGDKMTKSLNKGQQCTTTGTNADNPNHFICRNLEILTDETSNRKKY